MQPQPDSRSFISRLASRGVSVFKYSALFPLLSATSPAASKAELILRQRLLHFFVPYWYPTTLRDIRVARQRWRLEVLLTGKTHGFMPRISALVFRPPYRWAGTIPYPSRVDGYAPAIRHWTVVTYVIDFVYPKLNDRSRDAEG